MEEVLTEGLAVVEGVKFACELLELLFGLHVHLRNFEYL